jgi:hypothetical protein
MFACSAYHENWLRTKWQALTESIPVDKAASDAALEMLVRRYSEPHRAYHNLSHITALLHHADANREFIDILPPSSLRSGSMMRFTIHAPRTMKNAVRYSRAMRCRGWVSTIA